MSHGSTAKIDQKEYLKKYLSGDKSKKKKKKKDKDKEKSKKVRIIDDDASAFQPDDDDEMLLYGEDAPQIVGEYIETKPNGDAEKKWRSIAVKDEVHMKQEADEDRWGKKASARVKDENATKVKREATPDISPPRKRDRKRRETGSDQSPSRQRRHKMEPNDFSSPRNRKNGVSPRRRHASIEQSPPRRRHDANDQLRQKRRLSTDLSPARIRRSRDGNKDQSLSRRRDGSLDQSPPRRRRNSVELSPSRQQLRQQKQISRDFSPPRKQKNNMSPRRFDGSVDQSPPRRHHVSLDKSPTRRRQLTPLRQQKSRFSHNSSPPRKGRYGSAEHSPPGRSGNNNMMSRIQKETRRNSPGFSPPNRKGRDFAERAASPQRQTEYLRTERQSPATRFRQRSRSFERNRNNNAWNSTAQRQSNFTNPFAQKGVSHQQEYNSPEKRQLSQQRRRDDFFGKSSSSLERNRQNLGNNRRDNSALHREMSDQSPPRRRQRGVSPRQENRRVSPSLAHTNRRTGSTDRLPIAPPKVTIHWETAAMVAQRKARRSPESPPPTHKAKATKTLDGKKAGLQDARALKEETAARRRDEEKMFAKMSSELTGRDAEVQVRSTGRRGRRARDAKEEDPEKQRLKEEREQQRKEQYDRWGKGLKQIENHRARLAEQEYESSKPLARYADDEDLDRHLREKERAEDPMLDYIRRKKRETDKKTNSKSKVPVYEGSYPENRFGIPPGHRWDGVDRSCGYEKKWFDVQNEKRAVQEDAYKYSVEDM